MEHRHAARAAILLGLSPDPGSMCQVMDPAAPCAPQRPRGRRHVTCQPSSPAHVAAAWG